MSPHRIVLPALGSALATGVAAVLLLPATGALAFAKVGGDLPLDQRDFRVLNNFRDRAANNNVSPHPQFPGVLGAEMAIWKAFAEWGSGPHGDGSGDGSQPNLGDGGANFDAAWGGNASSIGVRNTNTLSTISNCNPGVIAFTEIPVPDGWRIRFCEVWRWSDGPLSVGATSYDIQAVAAHEAGHAMGLGHSDIVTATMFPTSASGSLSERSLDPDDMLGLQCIYGVKSVTKPEITAVAAAGGMLTIDGLHFDPLDNTIWFRDTGPTSANADPILRVAGVPSSAGGTLISVAIPPGAQPGDVLVQLTGQSSFESLSNAFPTDLGQAPLPVADAVVRNGIGLNPSCLTAVGTPVLGTTWTVQVDGSGHPGVSMSHVQGRLLPHPGVTMAIGELLVDLTSAKVLSLTVPASGGVDAFAIPIPADALLVGHTSSLQAVLFGGPGPELCNALDVTLGV